MSLSDLFAPPPRIPVRSGRIVSKMREAEQRAAREREERNKDKVAAAKRKYYERNKDKIAAAKREYYERNKDKWRTVYAKNRKRGLRGAA